MCPICFRRTFDGGCNSETEVEIEVWDWDRLTPDDRIGSLRTKLGPLVTACGTKLALNPQLNGFILVRSAEFRGIVGPATQSPDPTEVLARESSLLRSRTIQGDTAAEPAVNSSNEENDKATKVNEDEFRSLTFFDV
jgi:hypothetical protein